MLASALIAPVPGLSPEAYRRFLQNQIIFYPDQLLACGQYVIFYSGPTRNAYAFANATAGNNNSRSKFLALALGATRINDTETASFLDDQDLRSYFNDYLFDLYHDPDRVEDEAYNAYATVWGGPSEILAQRNFIKAATVVCGANPRRVFVADEMQPLLENPVNKFTNEIPTTAPKRMLFEVSRDDAFDLLCRSELKLVQTLAQVDISNFTWWSKDFEERIGFYTYERMEAAKTASKLTADQENKKKEIIHVFKLEAMYATQPASWGCKLPAGVTPPAKAPILSLIK